MMIYDERHEKQPRPEGFPTFKGKALATRLQGVEQLSKIISWNILVPNHVFPYNITVQWACCILTSAIFVPGDEIEAEKVLVKT